jgi:Stigma-specific protein, Stig1
MPEQQEHHTSQDVVHYYSSSAPSPHSGGSSIATSFDELAKGLATGTLSRGKALRWMGSALLGAALASVPGVAWANDDCRRLGRECRRDSQCCSRNCIRRGDDKVCGCPTGRTRCKDDRCVNLETNERHCGECFNRCAEGQECVEGKCSGGEPICDPPCTDAEHECVEVGGGQTFCQPICPGCDCTCFDLADGTGVACAACDGGCPVAPNFDCSQCPTDTICVVTPLSTAPLCCHPAA